MEIESTPYILNIVEHELWKIFLRTSHSLHTDDCNERT